ncbi:MAG: hypothetical protein U0165_09850 [Polyangiaceae bacterium]
MAKPNHLAELEKHAEQIRNKLHVPKQNALFEVAVEAGYLAALADGNVDADERAAIVKAVETLSVGAVIEWETEALLDSCAARAKAEGIEARRTAAGKALAGLGHPDVGLFFAAVIAHASDGIDDQEKASLEAIGAAAGLDAAAVAKVLDSVKAELG